MEGLIPIGSPLYLVLLSLLISARGMDFFSTWLATPNLVLEANPIAKKLGWRWGLISNAALCLLFAAWPLPAIVIITTSMLVAARNLQSAWLMRSLGENDYRLWISERMAQTPRPLYYFCLLGQTAIYGMVGSALLYYSEYQLVPVGIGMGLVTYALAVLVYSLLSVWRISSRKL
jgi:hypothetical protein